MDEVETCFFLSAFIRGEEFSFMRFNSMHDCAGCATRNQAIDYSFMRLYNNICPTDE